MKERRFNSFSVPLGLLDYVNPILYTVTMITVIRNIGYQMAYPLGMYMFIGVLISVFFGFIIPTGKVLVGLGIIRFHMPVSLVFCVNSGILISGLLLFHYVMKLKFIAVVMMFSLIVILLILLYLKNRKMNTISGADWGCRLSADLYLPDHFVFPEGNDRSGHPLWPGHRTVCHAVRDRHQSRSEESEGTLGDRRIQCAVSALCGDRHTHSFFKIAV